MAAVALTSWLPEPRSSVSQGRVVASSKPEVSKTASVTYSTRQEVSRPCGLIRARSVAALEVTASTAVESIEAPKTWSTPLTT